VASEDDNREAERTAREAERESLAIAALERIKGGQHWQDWRFVADRLADGRYWAQRKAGTDDIASDAYRKAFGVWMDSHPWARKDIDKPTRTHLFWYLDNRPSVEAFRETLSVHERAKLNHPTHVKRRYEAAMRDKAVKDGKATKPETPSEKIAALQAKVVALEAKLSAKGDDGSLYDVRKTPAPQKARIHLEHAGLEKTISYRDELSKVIDAARKRKARPAG
jgi:hypothetical protein